MERVFIEAYTSLERAREDLVALKLRLRSTPSLTSAVAPELVASSELDGLSLLAWRARARRRVRHDTVHATGGAGPVPIPMQGYPDKWVAGIGLAAAATAASVYYGTRAMKEAKAHPVTSELEDSNQASALSEQAPVAVQIRPEKITQAHDAYPKEKKTLEDTISSRQQGCAEKDQLVAGLDARYVEAQNNLKASEGKVTELTEALSKTREELSQIKEDLSGKVREKEALVDSLTQENQSLAARNLEVVNKLLSASDELDKSKQTMGKAASDFDEKVKQLEERVKTLCDGMNDMKQVHQVAVAEKDQQIAELRKRHTEELSSQNAESLLKIDSLTKQNADLTEKLSNNETQLAASMSANKALQEQIEQVRTTTAVAKQLNTKLDDAKRQLEAREEEKKALTGLVSSLSGEVTGLQETNRKIVGDMMHKAEEEKKLLADALEKSEKGKSDLLKAKSQLEKRVNDLEDKLKTEQEAHRVAVVEKEEMLWQKNTLERKCTDLEGLKQETSASIGEKEALVDSLKQERDSLVANNLEIEENLASVTNELQSSRQAAVENESARVRLVRELEERTRLHEALSECVSSLTGQVAELQRRNNDYVTELSANAEIVITLEEANRQNREVCKDHLVTVTENERMLGELQERNDQVRTMADVEKQLNTNLKNKLDAAKWQLEAHEGDKKTLNDQIEELKRVNMEIANMLEETNQRLKGQMENLQEANRQRDEQKDSFATEKKTFESTIREMTRQKKNLETELNEATSGMKTANVDRDKLASELEEAKRQHEVTVVDKTTLDTLVTMEKESLRVAQHANTQLNEELTRTQKQVNELTQQNRKVCEDHLVTVNENERMLGELRSEKTQLEEERVADARYAQTKIYEQEKRFEDEKDRLTSEMETVVSEKMELSNQREESLREIESLQKQNTDLTVKLKNLQEYHNTVVLNLDVVKHVNRVLGTNTPSKSEGKKKKEGNSGTNTPSNSEGKTSSSARRATGDPRKSGGGTQKKKQKEGNPVTNAPSKASVPTRKVSVAPIKSGTNTPRKAHVPVAPSKSGMSTPRQASFSARRATGDPSQRGPLG